MRPQTACVACRKRRRRCDWSSTNESCVYCKKRNVICSFIENEVPHSSQQSPMVASTHSGNSHSTGFSNEPLIIPPAHVCLEVIGLYFRYMHDIQLSLFHRPTFIAGFVTGTIPMVILMAILGLSARFSNDPYFENVAPRMRGQPFTAEAEKLLNLSDVSTTTVRACLLLGACYGSEGKTFAENIHYTIACRMGLLLDIPNVQALDQLDQELNTRLWWALIMSDVWTANGVQVPRLLTIDESVPYPMDEGRFMDLRHNNTEGVSPLFSISDNSGNSMLAQMLKLNNILIEISDMNRAASNHPMSFTFDRTIEALERKLDAWYAGVPMHLRDTRENMISHADGGHGGTFVAIYLGYYHYGQLLFYQYLHQNIHEDDQISSKTTYYAEKCKAYSTSLCDIVYRAMSTPGAEVLYSMVGHVLVIASTIQLHTLLFGSDEIQIRNARRRLERNFEILTRLQELWPFDNSFERFKEFHRACQRSKESSFRMDKWMLRFLFENSKPIHEKPDDEAVAHSHQLWSTQELGFSPYDALT